MNVPIKLTKMSQTFAENNNSEENEIKCCICYDDNSEEGNKGKLIECCPNKHILCIECFHKSYERKCECPLCRELMFRPEIMTDVEAFAYYGAKLALKQKREREEQQRQFRLAEAERQRQAEERQRVEVERRRQEELARLPIRKAERKQRIQRQNDELLFQRDELLVQIAINNAEIENINNLLDLDAYNAIYPPNFEQRILPPHTIISDSDTDDDSVELIYGPHPRPVQPVTPVQQPRPVQQPVTPVQQPRPVQQPATPVQQPRPVQQTRQEQERHELRRDVRDELRIREFRRITNEIARRREANESEDVLRAYSDAQINSLNAAFPMLNAAQQPVTPVARPVQQPRPVQNQNPVARPVQQPAARPVQQRRSSTYARDKLRQDDILVQTLMMSRMFLRYNRLNDTFIRTSNNKVYPTLNSASVDHAEEVGLSYHPNAWTTFRRSDGSRIDNL